MVAKKKGTVTIFKKKVKESFVEVAPQAPVADQSIVLPMSAGPLCDCGEPVAEGQQYVCKRHIRST